MEFPARSSTTYNKFLLLGREQVYLDKIKPTLISNKVAGSVLSYKHT